MRGYPEFNFPEFNRLAAQIRDRGFSVLNPAEYGATEGWTQEQYLTRDLIALLQECTAIAVMKGWENSWGAKLEVYVAKQLGYPVLDAETLLLHEESVMHEAERLINGARQEDYGHPLDDFTKTGRMWGAILGLPDIEPEKIGLMMVALKISRELNWHKRDNLVDGCGYFGTIELIKKERAKREFFDQYYVQHN